MKAIMWRLMVVASIGWSMAITVAGAVESVSPMAIRVTAHESMEQPKDWLNLSDVSLESQNIQETRALVSPLHGAIVYQTPPDFTWAWADYNYADLTYEVEIRYPNGEAKNLTTDKTFLSGWPEFLYASIEPYWWRVRALRNGKVHKDWGQWRVFYVAHEALAPDITDVNKLYQTAANKARPRTFPAGEALTELRQNYIGPNAPFRNEWLSYTNKAWGGLDALMDKYPNVGTGEAPGGDLDILIKAAFVWKITQDTAYLEEAKRRLLNISSWDPDGSAVRCDWGDAGHRCRAMVVDMALAYDWLYHDLTAEEQETVKNAIMAKFPQTSTTNLGFAHYTQDIFYSPMESWGANALNQMVAVTSLMAGEDPMFESYFQYQMPYYLTKAQLWGNEDGGFGNGMSYGAVDIDNTMIGFHVVTQTTGYDLSRKHQFAALPYFWLYFQPPVAADRIYDGTTQTWMPGAFGDGAEQPLMSYYLKSGVNMFVSQLYQTITQKFAPTIRWYANRVNGDKVRNVHWVWMIKPVEKNETEDVLAPSLYSSALFPAVGQVAMHSSLSDLERTSIYFRSSEYGSQSHNHADQNSFVVHSGGVPLLIDSGYYDAYQSNHYYNWYNQTKAHNAITFDGGQGQPINARTTTGMITKYFHDRTNGDLTEVIGDATEAYAGQLAEAKRSLVYVKNDLLIVHDKLSSDISRRWEWNLHAMKEMEVLSDHEVKINHQGKTACVSMYSLAPFAFSQTDSFGENAAPRSGANQWHGQFATLGKGKSNEFLAIIRVGCGTTPTVETTPEGWNVILPSRTVQVTNGNIRY